jgi:hypothetical protein
MILIFFTYNLMLLKTIVFAKYSTRYSLLGCCHYGLVGLITTLTKSLHLNWQWSGQCYYILVMLIIMTIERTETQGRYYS